MVTYFECFPRVCWQPVKLLTIHSQAILSTSLNLFWKKFRPLAYNLYLPTPICQLLCWHVAKLTQTLKYEEKLKIYHSPGRRAQDVQLAGMLSQEGRSNIQY